VGPIGCSLSASLSRAKNEIYCEDDDTILMSYALYLNSCLKIEHINIESLCHLEAVVILFIRRETNARITLKTHLVSYTTLRLTIRVYLLLSIDT